MSRLSCWGPCNAWSCFQGRPKILCNYSGALFPGHDRSNQSARGIFSWQFSGTAETVTGDWGAGRGGLDDCRSWVSRSVDTHSLRAPDGPVGRHMVAYGCLTSLFYRYLTNILSNSRISTNVSSYSLEGYGNVVLKSPLHIVNMHMTC